MASLRSYLPPAGSTVWRNERRSTRTSSSGEADSTLSQTRIKHIVIREVWKRDLPSPHALYKIDVMTQSNHWFILRRYREFHSLHINLVKQYHIPSDMLPTKKLFSNMSLTHLEKRRNALEHYLQRLINSHHDIAESQELFQFLNVQTHDVLCVTRQLAKVLENDGRNILASGGVFTFSPTQMYCITRQLQLPHVAIEQSDTSNPGDEMVDLGYLYGFIQELKNLCVSGVASRLSPCQELISNQAFDISLFKSLQKLQIEKCHISVIDGLFRIQKQLTHVTLKNCLKSMKEFLVDSAMQKRAIKQAASNVEPWRNMSTTKLTDKRVVVRPWILLTHVNLSHNNIAALDHSLKLLPSLEQLDLSHNEFVHLDLEQLTSSTLTFLNLSHNNIHYVSATSRDLRNLKSLLLTNNKLQSLEGVECLRGLVELDVRFNEIKAVEELVKISSLLHLRILALTGNPCVALKSYRIQVFCQLKARELILDGIKMTESEKAKVILVQGRKVPSTDVVQSHKPNTVVQTQANQDLRKKVTPYRDDDQDSGIGGNYTGSVDEGGLVFDWSCYNNCMDITSNCFPYHVAGPSTSRSSPNLSRSSPFGMNASTQVPKDKLSSCSKMSVNETHRSNNGDISSLESHARANPSDETLENTFPDSSDYRGKQPRNKHNFKRNIKSSSSPHSTLLQLSLNDTSCKRNETTGQGIKTDDNGSLLHPRNNVHSIKENTKSTLPNTFLDNTNFIQTNSNSIQENTNSVNDSTRNITDSTTSGEDGAKSIYNNENITQISTKSVKENTTSVQIGVILMNDNKDSIQDNTNSGRENTILVQESTIAVERDTTQDNANFAQENSNLDQEYKDFDEDNAINVQKDTTSVQDSTNSVQNDTNSGQENTIIVQGDMMSNLDSANSV